MKNILILLITLLVLCLSSPAQKITRKCSGSIQFAKVEILITGDIEITPCPGKTVSTNGNLISSPKRYLALLTQTSTDAPTVVVLENSLSDAIVWGRTSAGLYTGTLADAFTSNKTACRISNNFADAYASVTIARTSADVITITSKLADNAGALTSVVADAQLSATVIECLVYP